MTNLFYIKAHHTTFSESRSYSADILMIFTSLHTKIVTVDCSPHTHTYEM